MSLLLKVFLYSQCSNICEIQAFPPNLLDQFTIFWFKFACGYLYLMMFEHLITTIHEQIRSKTQNLLQNKIDGYGV